MSADGFLKRTGDYNPDILSCLANLSNDEVFTPPEIANRMLDLLPQKLFRNPKTTFLDPACKTGVFLREIAKRLMIGLAEAIPDEQERREHIFRKQLFGIAITELTALLSRRSLYCSKDAAGRYSVVPFATSDGNIRFPSIRHTWKNGHCLFCGASQKANDRDSALETHAYAFIHTHDPKELFNRHFDVIIGNPPYQMEDGGASASAKPVYHLFIDAAKKLLPRYLIMIVPARWYAGGKGLDDFRSTMLHDRRIRTIVDFQDSTDCFMGVSIKGGVCYFLWDRDNKGMCHVINRDGTNVISEQTRELLEDDSDVFVRYNSAISILRKVKSKKEDSFASLISSRKPFGFESAFRDYHDKPASGLVKIYANKEIGYVERVKITQNLEWLHKSKVLITRAYGAGEEFPHQIVNKPLLAADNSCCTETYLVIGPFDNDSISRNVISYISTKLFRFLVLLKKNTQDATSKVYSFVPIQDFSKPWTDEELYKKYKLTTEEIAFIESMIRPMEVTE